MYLKINSHSPFEWGAVSNQGDCVKIDAREMKSVKVNVGNASHPRIEQEPTWFRATFCLRPAEARIFANAILLAAELAEAKNGH